MRAGELDPQLPRREIPDAGVPSCDGEDALAVGEPADHFHAAPVVGLEERADLAALGQRPGEGVVLTGVTRTVFGGFESQQQRQSRVGGPHGLRVRDEPQAVGLIEQLPGVTNVMTNPATVQTGVVLEASVTGRPELAVAVAVSGVASIVWLPGLVKVMLWLSWAPGVTLFDGVDAGPVPATFVAWTVNV